MVGCGVVQLQTSVLANETEMLSVQSPAVARSPFPSAQGREGERRATEGGAVSWKGTGARASVRSGSNVEVSQERKTAPGGGPPSTHAQCRCGWAAEKSWVL